MPGTDRRSSTSSEDASLPISRQILPDGSEIIPTRTAKTGAPKPAANPLQFIKVGPCDLYKAAQEQLKKVEEIKKVEKTVKEESEDWQSNLDNWKCSRRKRQEHIIDRVVEVKKLELEEHERNKRRGKTLNEMMEERSQKGVGPRKMSLMTYPEDDATDLSDLGITAAEKGDENDEDGVTLHSDHDQNPSSNGNKAFDNQSDVVSPDAEEYTYERAIQGYKTFAEKSAKNVTKLRVSPPKPGGRIGEKLNELEQVRLRSNSVTDVQLPKVDIHKRRSLFEVVESADTKSPSAERIAKDLGGAQIVRQRLSSLEKQPEVEVKPIVIPDEIGLTLKDRLSHLEKQTLEHEPPRCVPSDDIGLVSIKERLTSLSNGCKESVISSCSDEEIGHKELLSPAASDREVSSPLVSCFNTHKKVDTNIDDGTNPQVLANVDSFGDGKQVVSLDFVNSQQGSGQDIQTSGDHVPKPDDHSPQSRSDQVLSSIDDQVPSHVDDQDPPHVDDQVPSPTNDQVASPTCDQVPSPTDDQVRELSDDQTPQPPRDQVLQLPGGQVPQSLVTESSDPSGDQVHQSLSELVPQPHDDKIPAPPVDQVSHSPSSADPVEPSLPSTSKSDECQNQSRSSHDNEAAIDPSFYKSVNPKQVRQKPPKPTLRTRKLTPLPLAPLSPVLSPLQPPGELQIISENSAVVTRAMELSGIHEAEEDDSQVCPASISPVPPAKGAETSESGIDMEESSLYTDENIDEVLGDDVDDEGDYEGPNDAHNVPDSASDLHRMRRLLDQPRRSEPVDQSQAQDEVVTRFDEFVEPTDTKEITLCKEQEPVARLNDLLTPASVAPNEAISEIVSQIVEESTRPVSLPLFSPDPAHVSSLNYENVGVANQKLGLSCPGDVVLFPLSPTSCVEPPKEKPPPPPVDISDEETEAPQIPPKASVRRLDSTKRIKKEIRKKRSDFLGIQGSNDDVYLEPEVGVEPPPDMMALLEEERRLDHQLYQHQKSLSFEAETLESNTPATNPPEILQKSIFFEQNPYRQSICSETDSNHETNESRDSGVELDHRDRGHSLNMAWTTSAQPTQDQVHTRSVDEDEIARQEQEIIRALEKEEKRQYGKSHTAADESNDREKVTEKLRELEEEKLKLEWARAEEEGKRMAEEERMHAKETLLRQQETLPPTNQSSTDQENLRSERERLEKEQLELARVRQRLLAGQQRSLEKPQQGPIGTNLRYSMPDLQEARPPPTNPRPSASWSRIPSADNLLANSDHNHHQQQQMSRTTLNALSAAPRSRIVNGEAWMQPKRKADATKGTYNYQHWLIQEAEHRRITEQQQRVVQSRRSLPNQPRPAAHAIVTSPRHHSPARPHSEHYPHITSPVTPNHVVTSPVTPNHAITSPVRTTSVPYSAPVVNNTHSHSMVIGSHHMVGLPPAPHPHPHPHHTNGKPLPDSVIQTLTQRVQNKTSPKKRMDDKHSPSKAVSHDSPYINGEQERMLSVSGKKKCSHCSDELGRGAAMVIESLRLFYHIDCFKCCVCHTQLGDGLMGTDVRVRNNKLHCHNCYSSDDGVKFSCV